LADIRETGLLHQEELIPTGDRTAYSLRPRLDVSGKLRRQHLFQDYIGKLKPAARVQDPMDFGKELRFVRGEVDDPVGENHIESIVGKRKRLRGHMDYFDVVDRDCGKVCLCSGDHLGSEVNAINPARFSCQAGGDNEVESCATANIQHDTALLDRRHGKGIAHSAKRIQQGIRRIIKKLRCIPQFLRAFPADRVFEISCGR